MSTQPEYPVNGFTKSTPVVKPEPVKIVTVNQDNLIELFQDVLLANVRLQNYSSHVISTKDVQKAIFARRVVLTFVEELVESGNNPYLVIGPILTEFDYDMTTDFNENWDIDHFAHISTVIPFSFTLSPEESSVCQNMLHLANITRDQFEQEHISIKDYLDAKDYR